MSGTKVNDYSISDTNIETLMLTTDQIFKGKCQCTLTEMDTTTVPEIAAGSYVEVAGTLFKFDSDESISTTDPVTSSTVADGTVYVMIVPSTDTCAAAFTATAPTWSDSKQGWYGTGAHASYRYVGLCLLYSGYYVDKKIVTDNRFPFIGRFSCNSDSNLSMSASTNYAPSITPISSGNQYTYHPIANTITLNGGDILIPETGIYRFTFKYVFLKTTTGNYSFYFMFRKNGSNTLHNIWLQKTRYTTSSQVIDIFSESIKLTKGDLLDFVTQSDGGGVLSFDGYLSYIEIFKIF